jgi:hypothetical protein
LRGIFLGFRFKVLALTACGLGSWHEETKKRRSREATKARQAKKPGIQETRKARNQHAKKIRKPRSRKAKRPKARKPERQEAKKPRKLASQPWEFPGNGTEHNSPPLSNQKTKR